MGYDQKVHETAVLNYSNVGLQTYAGSINNSAEKPHLVEFIIIFCFLLYDFISIEHSVASIE